MCLKSTRLQLCFKLHSLGDEYITNSSIILVQFSILLKLFDLSQIIENLKGYSCDFKCY